MISRESLDTQISGVINQLRHGQTDEMKALLSELDAMTDLKDIYNKCLKIKEYLQRQQQHDANESSSRPVILGAKQLELYSQPDNAILIREISELQSKLKWAKAVPGKIASVERLITAVSTLNRQENIERLTRAEKKDCKKSVCASATGALVVGSGLTTTAVLLGLEVGAVVSMGGAGILAGAILGKLIKKRCCETKQTLSKDLEEGLLGNPSSRQRKQRQSFTGRFLSTLSPSEANSLHLEEMTLSDRAEETTPLTDTQTFNAGSFTDYSSSENELGSDKTSNKPFVTRHSI